jgi:hypothetical protein
MIAFVALVLFLLAALGGCANDDASGAQPEGGQSSGTPAQAVWIKPGDSIDMDGMNLFWQNDNLYFPADGNARLSLYVHAEKDDNGEFIFDDGQEWLLVMETSIGDFPLFPRKYVQLGRVEYTVFNGYGDNGYDALHVLVAVHQTASLEVFECIFDNDEQAFKAVPVYKAENINHLGRSG